MVAWWGGVGGEGLDELLELKVSEKDNSSRAFGGEIEV